MSETSNETMLRRSKRMRIPKIQADATNEETNRKKRRTIRKPQKIENFVFEVPHCDIAETLGPWEDNEDEIEADNDQEEGKIKNPLDFLNIELNEECSNNRVILLDQPSGRKKGQSDCSLKIRKEIIKLWKEGIPAQVISGIVNLSKRQVTRWVQRYETCPDDPLNTTRSGRTKLIDEKTLSEITEIYNSNPFVNMKVLRQTVKLTCNDATIRRSLHERGVTVPRIPYSLDNVMDLLRERITFAENHQTLNWSKVIFTSEKTFYYDMKGTTITNNYLWQPESISVVNHHLIKSRTTKSRYNHHFHVTFWGWATKDGPGRLTMAKKNGKITVPEYISLLEKCLLPSVNTTLKENHGKLYIIQDSYPIFSDKVVLNWFKNHPQFELLYWPTRSMDLNPMEILWNVCVEDCKDDSAEQLESHISRVWDGLRGTEFCRNLVEKIPAKIDSIIKYKDLWRSSE